MSKWTSVQGTFRRAHGDLFPADESYTATFLNYPEPGAGDYNPDTGEINEGSRTQFAEFDVEIVPPGMDTTVDVDGSSLSYDTSIRFPDDKLSTGELVPLGPDNQQPTVVEITDPQASDKEVFELHGYTFEKGSGMLLCRLVEE